ncbi:BolA family protein [Ghiorsea bivora]|uniref:BolA family protein n=1 Tax=Ghiorsea bivora TaxID=1485545 RepID=UPI00056EA2B3|nr:BolA/IbaG family iron-sulfur metabolism protein [Ghiorsea bivora]
MSGTEKIKQALMQTFSPTQLDIIDESHLHAGHEGAKSGGGHYVVHIVDKAFTGKNKVQRHRMVNEATQHLFPAVIHALSIKAQTPDENL